MDISLPVPYFPQEHAKTCGVAALRMALGYCASPKSEKEILKYVPLHSFGTFSTDFGELIKRLGYKVTGHTFHLSLLAPLKIPFGTEIAMETLNKIPVKPKDKMVFESWQRFIAAGGKLIWNYPRVGLVEECLSKKVPAIVNYKTAALNRFWKNANNGHYLVVTGSNDDSFEVLDPDPWTKEYKYHINKELFLPAWSINAPDSSDFLTVIERL